MLRLVHRMAGEGWVYDRIQRLAGARQLDERLRGHLEVEGRAPYVLDVGGGTGRVRMMLPADYRYMCVDLEEPKLRHLRNVPGLVNPIKADATALPFRSASVDLVLCLNVAHHLSDDGLDQTLAEVGRVLRPGGRFVFVDALINRSRVVSSALWRLDRGSNPRQLTELRAAVRRRFSVDLEEHFRLAHDFVLLVACDRSRHS